MKTLFSLIGIFMFSILYAGEGEAIFKKTCAACHTIGKGRLVGPDLQNITQKQSREWLLSFIKSSTAMIQSGDADAVAIFEEYNRILMPDNNYTDNQILAVLDYISQGSTGEAAQETGATTDILSETTPDNISGGALLFEGKRRLANGGPSCGSCHKVRDDRIFSSGTLAKDLSRTYENMGSAGVAAIVKNPPFPVMHAAYKNHPLTEQEIVDLTAYLKSVNKQWVYQVPTNFSMFFIVLGISVFIVILMATIILYFKRKRFAVNQDILNRPSKVIN